MTRDDLPDPGEDRYWIVTHQPRSRTTPVKIELRRQLHGTKSPKFTELLGYENTIANHEKIVEAMQLVLDRVGDVDRFVGVY